MLISDFICILMTYVVFVSAMISTEQWRAAIGSFRPCINYGCSEGFSTIDIMLSIAKARILAIVFYILSCVIDIICIVCLYNVGKLLIVCSNDVELNPGPVVYKTCPNCGSEVVPIKKNVLMDIFS